MQRPIAAGAGSRPRHAASSGSRPSSPSSPPPATVSGPPPDRHRRQGDVRQGDRGGAAGRAASTAPSHSMKDVPSPASPAWSSRRRRARGRPRRLSSARSARRWTTCPAGGAALGTASLRRQAQAHSCRRPDLGQSGAWCAAMSTRAWQQAHGRGRPTPSSWPLAGLEPAGAFRPMSGPGAPIRSSFRRAPGQGALAIGPARTRRCGRRLDQGPRPSRHHPGRRRRTGALPTLERSCRTRHGRPMQSSKGRT